MTILKIARMGHPVLHRVAADVPDPTTPEIRALVADMIETMHDADGTGLAAPQVHVPLRIVTFLVEDERAAAAEDEDEKDSGVPLTAMINPVVEPLSDERSTDWEACLSVPGLAGAVERWNHICYRFTTPDGTTVTREARGFHARVVQHECDHLDGMLYPMRMNDLSRFGWVEELNRATAKTAERKAADD